MTWQVDRRPRASQTASGMRSAKAAEIRHSFRPNPFFRGSVGMMIWLSVTAYSGDVVRIENGRRR
jgi:hypothetical protein